MKGCSVFRDVTGPCLAPGGSVLTVGAFDGLHRGHRALLERVHDHAAALDCAPAVVSFEPLPRSFFSAGGVPRLNSVREKIAGLAEAHMESVLLLRFNAALAATSAEDFVRRVLVERMAAREVWVGRDFRFGHKRAGDLALLERMGAEMGFRACAIPSVEMDGERVSATRIRTALEAGRFDDAARLLGRRFTIGGHVVHGTRMGHRLGYPTANIPLGRRVSPVQGIFAVRVHGIGAHARPGVASLGVRPTITGNGEPLLEAHVFDFDGDLYGQRLDVEFVARLRDEEKFANLDALKRQMDDDADRARQMLGVAYATGA